MKPLLRGPIAARLFIFNILVVFMPVAGFFSLSFYEDQLLTDMESSLVQQGRIISAWLAADGVTSAAATELLLSLRQNHTARIRIVDAAGTLLADSAALGPRRSETAVKSDSRDAYEDSAPQALIRRSENTLLYRALSLPVRFFRKYLQAPSIPLDSADFYSGKTVLSGREIQSALEGRYGAITRISSGGQTSVTLYSALPVTSPDGVTGAVLVSQSTYRLLANLYDFRLEIGKIFLISLVTAALVSLLLALTISRPLSRLRREAEAVTASGAPPAAGFFHTTGRDDEIDRLSRALTTLLESQQHHIRLSENFASDAAHELRNRIAGIRTSAELLPGSSASEVQQAAALIQESAGRMEEILSALRELSRIEACGSGGLAALEPVLETLLPSLRARFPEVRFECRLAPGADSAALPLSTAHLSICLENLLVNAASFSPASGLVSLEASLEGQSLAVSVRDQGPGIPEEHLSRVFERFFTWRPQSGTAHTGIGLALVEAVVRTAGGSVACANQSSGGALFTLTLPVRAAI